MRSSPLPTLGALTGLLVACVCAAALWPSDALADPANDFSLASPCDPVVSSGCTTNPPSLGAPPGGTVGIDAYVRVTSGTSEPVQVSVRHNIPGVSHPAPITATTPSSPFQAGMLRGARVASLGLQIGSTTPCGTYPVDVVGESSSYTHVTTVTVKVFACDVFTITEPPYWQMAANLGEAGSGTISTAVVRGSSTQPVSLSVSGLPAGATASFEPATVNAGDTSKLVVTTTSATPCGEHPLTITGTGQKDAGGFQQVKRATLPLHVIKCLVNGDFSDGVTGWQVMTDGEFAGAVTLVDNPEQGTSRAAQLTGNAVIFQRFIAPGGRLSLGFKNVVEGPPLEKTANGWVERDGRFDCGEPELRDTDTGVSKMNADVNGAELVAGHNYMLKVSHHAGAKRIGNVVINCDIGPTRLSNVKIEQAA